LNLDFGLGKLNSLPVEEAEIEFLKCCGTKTWATRMTAARPFASVTELLDKAYRIWWSLAEADWLEAFRSHPKIGEKKAAPTTSAQTQAWSEQEQSGTTNAALVTMQALAEGNRQYEERFGNIFIVCATGKSSEEILAILKRRLNNGPYEELRVAAGEQLKIAELRLEKLLKTLAG
jgi:OHCU decarboxylase